MTETRLHIFRCYSVTSGPEINEVAAGSYDDALAVAAKRLLRIKVGDVVLRYRRTKVASAGIPAVAEARAQ